MIESKAVLAVLRRYWTPPDRATPRVWHWATCVGAASRLVVLLMLLVLLMRVVLDDLTAKQGADCVRT